MHSFNSIFLHYSKIDTINLLSGEGYRCFIVYKSLPFAYIDRSLTKVRPNQICQDHKPHDYNQTVRASLTLLYLIGPYFNFKNVHY